MTNTLVTQLLEALLASSVNEDNLAQTTEAIIAAREYLATEPSGERAELIAKLRTGWTVMEESEFERLDDLCRKAVDMMDADAQQAKSKDAEQMKAYGQACREHALEDAAKSLEAIEAGYGVTDKGLPDAEYARMKQTAREQ